jgi:hypothetical protein
VANSPDRNGNPFAFFQGKRLESIAGLASKKKYKIINNIQFIFAT